MLLLKWLLRVLPTYHPVGFVEHLDEELQVFVVVEHQVSWELQVSSVVVELLVSSVVEVLPVSSVVVERPVAFVVVVLQVAFVVEEHLGALVDLAGVEVVDLVEGLLASSDLVVQGLPVLVDLVEVLLVLAAGLVEVHQVLVVVVGEDLEHWNYVLGENVLRGHHHQSLTLDTTPQWTSINKVHGSNVLVATVHDSLVADDGHADAGVKDELHLQTNTLEILGILPLEILFIFCHLSFLAEVETIH